MIPEFSICSGLLIALATPTAFYAARSLLFHYISISYIFRRLLTFLQDHLHSHNLYRIPRYNAHSQENQLFCRISAYIKSLPSLEDADFVSLFSGDKPGDIVLSLDSERPVTVLDMFSRAQITWTCQKNELVLKIRSRDKKRVLLPYMQHIHKVADEIEQRKKPKELKIHLSCSLGSGDGRWRSFPFVHPASFDTVVLDNQVKNRVKGDLDLFLKSKQYYAKIGRVWRRSYLLYGGSGTGKSTFAAAMANFLSYDLYDLDLSSNNINGSAALKTLLLQTTPRSLILVENLDRYLMGESTAVSLSTVLNFMDGIVSGCGEEQVMVFTMHCKDRIDPTVLRPGRVDAHIYFPFCDFSGFKSLASSHLGVKDHKLFGQVEDLFQNGSRVSPAEISEIMISNRASSTRALKRVVTTLENNGDVKVLDRIIQVQQRLHSSSSREQVSDESDGSGSGNKRESGNAIREVQKFYGLLKLKNSRKDDSTDSLGPN